MDIDDEFFLGEVADTTPADKPTGDIPLETLAEGSQRRQKIAKDRAQDRQTGQTLSKIVTQAAEDKPHHHKKTLGSLQNFTKAMMGLSSSAKPDELLTSVTTEQLAVWESWREHRKTAFKKCLDKETTKNPNPNKQEIKLIRKSALDKLKSRLVGVTFHSAAIVASSPISMHIKREMETDLAKAGFPRFTFDWNTRLLHDSVWNTVMVDITMRHWLPWAKRGNVEVMESALPGIKSQLCEWITNQGVTQKKAQLTPPELAQQQKYAQY
ncbi:uncharacterized protein VP01_8344g1, partial [Puccinia sorghi]